MNPFWSGFAAGMTFGGLAMTFVITLLMLWTEDKRKERHAKSSR